jgi:DNA-binding PadR family transcriptional regulator
MARNKDLDNFGRFSDPGLLILASLSEGPKHGYAMIQDIAQFSGTMLEPGTLYGALARLEQRGWVEAVDTQERRRPYRITDTGTGVLKQQMATMSKIVAVGSRRLGSTS